MDAAPPAAWRFLSAALLCASGTSRPPRTVELERLRAGLVSGDIDSRTLAGCRVVVDGDMVRFSREAGERARGGLAPLPLHQDEAVVWDGRFEVEADVEGLALHPLAGFAARLSPAERQALKLLPPEARPALPVLVDAENRPILPRPFGSGSGEARSLSGARLAAACGLIAQEGPSGPAKLDAPHGAAALVILS